MRFAFERDDEVDVSNQFLCVPGQHGEHEAKAALVGGQAVPPGVTMAGCLSGPARDDPDARLAWLACTAARRHWKPLRPIKSRCCGRSASTFPLPSVT